MNPQFKRMQVIINPAAGKGTPALNIMNSVFTGQGLAWDVSITQPGREGREQAQKAVEDGVDLVAVYGGDGTIMNVANGLTGSGIPMAILPGGTGNVIAAELAIPTNLRKAAELICDPRARIRKIDAGQINNHLFLLRADLGAPARVAEEATREMKNRYGTMAYFIAAFKTFFPAMATAQYRLILDNIAIESEGVACLVANMGTIGSLNLSLGADVSPSDGLLDVFLVKKGLDTTISVLTTAVANMIELSELGASLQHWKAEEVIIETEPVQHIHLDAEYYGDTPARISIVPGAIPVVVPGF
ncbi:MAG: diacylglycerol kinase family lipid kinase [Chloroflexi bacterium]|nr:MAG: hypothetical protein CUN54_08485 [Phototrophicales bacterium]RMF76407.1 MAG: diacylglycerol kinase family lipid kinase [Chloroflexota bacterium]